MCPKPLVTPESRYKMLPSHNLGELDLSCVTCQWVGKEAEGIGRNPLADRRADYYVRCDEVWRSRPPDGPDPLDLPALGVQRRRQPHRFLKYMTERG